MLNINDFERTGEFRQVNPGEFYQYQGKAWQVYGGTPTFFPYEILKPKEKGMKYKQLKTIRAETLMAEKPPERDFVIYLNHFGYEPVKLDDLLKLCGPQSCWVRWLIDHGFIEEIKKEKIYQAGTQFDALGQTYELRCHTWEQPDSECCIAGMFSVTYGNDWIGIMVKVKDRMSITEENIKKMFGDNTLFEPVKKDVPF